MELKYITQNECPSCRALEIYLKHNHLSIDIDSIRVNIDEDPSAIDMYGVMGTPTLIVWDEEEIEEVDRMVGYSSGEGDSVVDTLLDRLI